MYIIANSFFSLSFASFLSLFFLIFDSLRSSICIYKFNETLFKRFRPGEPKIILKLIFVAFSLQKCYERKECGP